MKEKRLLSAGLVLLVSFAVWTWAVQHVDVRPVGQMGTAVGFAELNVRFHELTGVHMWLYHITDWMGFVPVFVCVVFGGLGAVQLIRQRSLFRVDGDILLLGVYYAAVIAGYLLFEMIPVNYRPILIDGRLEASYPSSTTLLALSVMPTLIFQAERRLTGEGWKRAVWIGASFCGALMVIGRLMSGVHWLTDIVGSLLFSTGLFCIYVWSVFRFEKEENR